MPRKVNSIALRSPAALLCQKVVGRLLKIDYSAAAEVYYMPMRRRGGARQPLGYRRFATAAEAIRFVVEDFPAAHTLSPWMQVGDNRFDSDAIRQLYDSSDYPYAAAAKNSRRAVACHARHRDPQPIPCILLRASRRKQAKQIAINNAPA